jgi:prevent-host-death family protein
MVIMTISEPNMKKATVAEAKAHLSELLGEVAHTGRAVVITKRGRPIAKLVPADHDDRPHLAAVKGWLDQDDPFFSAIDEIVAERKSHKPRVP